MDLSHGHPSSLSHCSDRRTHPIFHRDSEPTTPSRQPTQHFDPPFGLQNRRLHLRNIGFRGTKVSPQRLGVKISRLFNATDVAQLEPATGQTKENNNVPPNRSSNGLLGDHYPSTTFGILQEISNSSRGRYDQKRANISIAEDNPERLLLDLSPAAATPETEYHNASSTQLSPLSLHTTNADVDSMKLREISGNERRSPTLLSSPRTGPARSRRKRGLDARTTTFEASEYIDHIENELQQVKEAMHSPNTGRPLQEKLKILQAENLQLKDTISELEETFDERLKAAVEHKAAIEVEMLKKIKTLKDELASKEIILRDVEHDRDQSKYDGSNMDGLRAVIDRLEQEKERLEEANRVIEKRNEALTGLLAQSPTRAHHSFEPPSPVWPGSRRSPRPKSMMVPRLASPSRLHTYQRPHSVQVSPPGPFAGCFSPNTVLTRENDRPYHTGVEIDPQKAPDAQSLDSGLGKSCSARSPVRRTSRRSSTASHVSTSPSAWSLPLTTSPSEDKATVKQNKHRRTRRFESGSTQLKPLLLPTMAAESTAFLVSYPPNSDSSPPRREISEQLLDTTVSYLPQPSDASTLHSSPPTQWASVAALKALEGSPEPQFETFEDIIARHGSELAGFTSSPISHQTLDRSNDEQEEEIEAPPYGGDPVIQDDITVLLHHPKSIATDQDGLSRSSSEASFNAPNQSRTWIDEQHVGSTPTASISEAPSGHQWSSDTRSGADYARLRPVAVNSTYELIPQALLLSSPLNGSRVASDMVMRRGSLMPISSRGGGSTVPRKRQRSSDPASCSFVMPTLCINSAHDATAHETTLSDKHMSSLTVFSDTRQKPPSGQPLSWAENSLDPLHKITPPPLPLTSITIRTIVGTLSRYTSYLRGVGRDPSALARRVIANAWQSNWKRLGKLSWWVLGLFLGLSPASDQLDRATRAGWDWDGFDGEAIAEEVNESKIGLDQCGTSSQQTLPNPSEPRWAIFNELDPSDRTVVAQAEVGPAVKPDNSDPKKQKQSWRKSLYLWGKFSVALMLAVSGAVINGPEEMLRDCVQQASTKHAPTIPKRMGDGPQISSLEVKQPNPINATHVPTTELSQPAAVQQASVATSRHPSGARASNDGSARSFSGAGAGTALGIVKFRGASSRTPSPACRRHRAAVSETKAHKKYTPRSQGPHEVWGYHDENSCLSWTKSGSLSRSNGVLPKPPPNTRNETLEHCHGFHNLYTKDLQ